MEEGGAGDRQEAVCLPNFSLIGQFDFFSVFCPRLIPVDLDWGDHLDLTDWVDWVDWVD